MARYASISFPYLLTDHAVRRNKDLLRKAFVLSTPERGRMVVVASSPEAVKKGICTGMVVADCKAVLPDLTVIEATPGQNEKILQSLAEWCIRFTPCVSLDMPDGLVLDTTGCSHLWGGEEPYIKNIIAKLAALGYESKITIADTISAAWGVARFGNQIILAPGMMRRAIVDLPPVALRLDAVVAAKLKKLGFNCIGHFIDMPASVLRRRFGSELPQRLAKALGNEMEILHPIRPVEPYQQRLPCLEPIRTPEGISIALRQLLEEICQRFKNEGIGLRRAVLHAYRIDGDIQQIEIGTGQPSGNPAHLFRLFENKITLLQPDLGFELFVLEATVVDGIVDEQSALWDTTIEDTLKISELIDRLAARMQPDCIKRYLPAEHHWPERSVSQTTDFNQKPAIAWKSALPRPVNLLFRPERIEVMVRVPDYPPIQFQYKGNFHKISKADGPERIEQEWWIESGRFRDYYFVEDAKGARFWLFRQGPYNEQPKWFIHGFFA